MKYNRLGNSGLIVSKLAFGAGALGVGGNTLGLKKNIPEKMAIELVNKALDAGITLFDSSDIYLQGQSETLLGKGLGARRKDALISTKTGLPTGDPNKNTGGLSYRRMIQACDESLKRLGTDWIDIYYCHAPDARTPMDESMRAWEHLVTSGRVRYVGVSNYQAWQAATLMQMQKNANFSPLVCNEVYHSLLGRQIERELVPMARSSGMGIITYEALAGGFLTGKYTKENPRPEGTRAAQFKGDERRDEMFPGARRFDGNLGYEIVALLSEIAKAHNCSVPQVVLAWTISKPWINSVIFGMTKMEHLVDNLGAVDITLSEEDIAKLDKISAGTAAV